MRTRTFADCAAEGLTKASLLSPSVSALSVQRAPDVPGRIAARARRSVVCHRSRTAQPPFEPTIMITFVHQTTRSGIGLIAAEPHGSTAGATKGGTAGDVFRRPPLASSQLSLHCANLCSALASSCQLVRDSSVSCSLAFSCLHFPLQCSNGSLCTVMHQAAHPYVCRLRCLGDLQ